MKSYLLAGFAALALSACSPAKVETPESAPEAIVTEPKQGPPDEIAALATVYSFHLQEASNLDCLVKLDDVDIDEAAGEYYRVFVEARCTDAFPELKEVMQWQPIGETGIRLIGGDQGETIAEFKETEPRDGWRNFLAATPAGRSLEMTATN